VNDLIKIEEVKGEPRIDSRLISNELGVENRATIQIINKYKERLGDYGEVTFQMLPSLNHDSKQKENVCFLNEMQATFLVTLSKNSENAVSLKQKLVESYHYYKSKNQPVLPKTFSEALQLAADQAKKLEEQRPKVEFAESIEQSTDSIEVGEFANVLCKKGIEIGRNRLFKILKDKDGLNLLLDTDKPRQYALDNKWMEVIEYTFQDKKEVDRLVRKVMITGRGQSYIFSKIKSLLDKDTGAEDFFKNWKKKSVE
jgi:phage antirepressor YoqD-like protein